MNAKDGDERIIENIKQAVGKENFNGKVQTGDPALSEQEKQQLVENYLNQRASYRFRVKRWGANQVMKAITAQTMYHTTIRGLERVQNVTGGAIVTSNHFSPIDSTFVWALTKKMKRNKLTIVAQESNLAMKGFIGFLMNYANTVPISSSPQYMSGSFSDMIQEQIEKNRLVLIYPEQEMWLNYRKPRPLKRGAYYYAAKLNVPIISCFVEMCTEEKMQKAGTDKIRYILYILDPIYPDPKKNVRENSIWMCRKDYEQKRDAYQKAYGKALNYEFDLTDIAG